MYSYVLYHNIEKSGFNAVSASLVTNRFVWKIFCQKYNINISLLLNSLYSYYFCYNFAVRLHLSKYTDHLLINVLYLKINVQVFMFCMCKHKLLCIVDFIWCKLDGLLMLRFINSSLKLGDLIELKLISILSWYFIPKELYLVCPQ